MPVRPTYPGVYIEEIPSGVRTITEVATSITAFLGYFARGPMDKAVQVFDRGGFESNFGGLKASSEAAYAIEQFFLNGGTEAWIVRLAKSGTARKAAIRIKDTANGGGTPVLLATAANEGLWGNNVRIDVDYATADPAGATTRFNLSVTEVAVIGGIQLPVRTEVFRNLLMDSTSPDFVVDVVNDGSKLIRVDLVGTPTSTQRPAQTGTVSQHFTSADLSGLGLAATDAMNVTLDGAGPVAVALGSPVPTTLAALATTLQARLRAAATDAVPLKDATVSLVGSVSTRAYLVVEAGTAAPGAVVAMTGALATKLGLNDAGRTNVQQYALGGADKQAQATPSGGQQTGADGDPPEAADILGDLAQKKGLFALEDVDTLNILSIPDTVHLADTAAAQVAAAAIAYCERRRAFYVLDVPHADKIRDEVDEIRSWLDANATLRHKNAATYYPRPRVADPLNGFRLRPVAPSGTMAGLYARIDGARGVWKAPAGTEAVLRGVQELEYKLTDPENGTLNPLAINCLRTFKVYGNVAWGARTLDGADQIASEWKYIPVRRLALFLEESLYRGTQWVVFEPNDEPLWAQIRLNVGAFMHTLFRRGAFQGRSPREAYLVKCDAETTTQNDRDLGVVNILVGFAPLKPAEFVIIKIQQLAGQIQT